MKRQRGVRFPLIPAISVLLMLVGCESDQLRGWSGPRTPVAVQAESWKYGDQPGRTLTTPHYIIRSTVDEDQFLLRLPQVMEGALQQYQTLIPGVELSKQPMDCYLFARRNDWANFTREHN